ncbi:MAG: RNA polymerase sigma factor [Deltaproteobacteria bacterium]|nr:RNA polymerase sigma factor [Deltaproteobacteria bacterium]
MEKSLEKRLIERSKQGDMTAFGELYRTYAPPLMARVIRPRVHEPADQEDVLVDTFRKALESLPGFRWMGHSFFSWLARIAKHRIIDQARAREVALRAEGRLEHEVVAQLAPHLARPDIQVLARANRALLGGRVDTILGAIHPRYATALRLRFLDGRSREACAAALDVSVATFDVVLLRSVRSFRAAWIERFGLEEGV